MPTLSWGHVEKNDVPKEEKPVERQSIMSFFASPQMEMLSRITHQKYDLTRWSREAFYARLKEKVEDIWDAIQHKSQEEVAQELVNLAAMCCQYYETHDNEKPVDLETFFNKS